MSADTPSTTPTQSPRQRRFNSMNQNLSPGRAFRGIERRLAGISNTACTPTPSHATFDTDAVASAPAQLYRFSGDSDNTELLPPLFNLPAFPNNTSTAPSIEDITHTNRLALQAEMTQGKGTEIAYPRQVEAYENFWLVNQAARQNHPTDPPTPAFPITATKVALYLQYATTRCKRTRDGLEIPGTTLGWESIKQIVSALESYRKHHQHEAIYRDCPESQAPLRNDIRIQVYEKAAKVTDAQKRADSQHMKALGAVSDTYTDDELIRGSMWLIRSSGKTKLQVHTGIRDRAMLLVSTTTAYRGDNTRRIAWSDLKLKQVILLDVGPDAKELALVFISNQGKTNTTGRIDEQAALRHRIPELCVLGAISFYFFSYFHVMRKPTPDFTPEYSGSSDDLGKRSWYEILLFPGAEGDSSEMSYSNHRNRVNTMKAKNNISINKVTHAGRPYAAVTAREHGASREDTKDLGGWSSGGSFGVYDRTLPLDAMIGAASFNARKQETYMIARAKIEPPQDLLSVIFPWIEQEEATRQARRQTHGKKGEDIALKNLLEFLTYARRIILQDAAVLFTKYSDCKVFDTPPFNTPTFRQWAASTVAIIAKAEADSRLQLQAFPPHMASSMRGILDESNLRQEQTLRNVQTNQTRLQDDVLSVHGELQIMKELIQVAAFPRSRRRRHTVNSRAITPAGTAPPTSTPGHIAASPSNVLPVVSPAPLPPTHNSPKPPTTTSVSSQTVSRNGHIYPVEIFPLSADLFEREQQLDSIEKLEAKFAVDRLRRHRYEWKISHYEWLPYYQWWKPSPSSLPTVEQIWTEHTHGMDGRLSICELNAGWEARWKRNKQRIKSEGSRRGKIINLIETLARKPNWTPTLALRFLKERYPIPSPNVAHLKTTRALIDHLQKSGGELFAQIMEASNDYP